MDKLQFGTQVLNLQTTGQFRGIVWFPHRGIRKVVKFRWSCHLIRRELSALKNQRGPALYPCLPTAHVPKVNGIEI